MKLEKHFVISEGFYTNRVFDFITLSKSVTSTITFYKDNMKANGKDMVRMMSLFLIVKKGDLISITAEGPNADAVLEEIITL
ncbi:HPr family phosphocarrier protein [Bacillus taeanensis]|nr:HPr family phosphocarrier protein [Bacillus taeanensis]